MILLLSSAWSMAAPPPEEEQGEWLRILHTNDLHCHYLPESAPWLEGEPAIGGMVALDSYLRQARAQSPELLLLDGGDLLTGTPLSDLEVQGAHGGALLSLMERAGYDAMALGNHEFDQGRENLEALIEASDFPILASNLLPDTEGGAGLPGLQSSIVLDRSGLRIGIIGAVTEGLHGLASAESLAGLDLRPVAESVRAEAQRLEEETDLLIALTHIGVDADRALARAVPELDLIVGGHSHTPLTSALREGNAWIVQAGSYGRSVGDIWIRWGDEGFESFIYELVDLSPEHLQGEASRGMRREVRGYQRSLEKRYGEVVGEASAALSRGYDRESLLGNWISDVLRQQTGADIGLYNGGGLRADLAAGELTRGDLFQVFPFNNRVMLTSIRGADLLSILLADASLQLREGGSGYLSLSGVSLVWREHRGAPELVEARVGDAPLDMSARYTLATNSYLVDQADRKLYGAALGEAEAMDYTVFEAAVRAAESGPILAPELGRVRQHTTP